MEERDFKLTLFLRNAEEICIYITTAEFVAPTLEGIQDINTIKQFIYCLYEIFGEALYEYIDAEILDFLEETELEEINEVEIVDIEEKISYYINMLRQTIDVE